MINRGPDQTAADGQRRRNLIGGILLVFVAGLLIISLFGFPYQRESLPKPPQTSQQ